MKKQSLTLYRARDETMRTVFKNHHGRLIFLALKVDDSICTIINHYYLDRAKFTVAKKLKTRTFPFPELQTVIANELDRSFDEVNIVADLSDLSTHEFIHYRLSELNQGYRFLIFIGEGELVNGIPSILKTRFKNRIHRSIYLEMQYRNGKGVISDCHYYDKKYRRRTVIPETLTTVFFDYDRSTILDVVNNELNTAFTHILFVTDGSLNIDNNEAALCGNI